MGRLEQKDIRYRGYSTLPDDYQVADGAIAFATNAVYEDGGLKMLSEAKPLQLLVAEGAQVFIHHTVNYYHYIIVYQTYKTDESGNEVPDKVRLYVVDREVMDDWFAVEGHDWVDAIYHKDATYNNMTEGVVDFLYECEGSFVSLVAVANTLVVSTDEEMYYFLCKPGGVEEQEALTENCDHPYIFLGNKVPSVAMEFALDLECKMKSFFDTGIEKTKSYESGEGETTNTGKLKRSKTLGGASFYFTATTTGEAAFPETVTLEKYNYYCLRFYADVDDYCHVGRVALFGRNIDTGETERIVVYDSVNTYTFFEVSENYDTITIQLVGTANDDNISSGTVFIDWVGNTYNDAYYVAATEDNYEAVQGCINKFVNEYSREKNRFMYPFFVRYAVRMYDDSVCELSVPILMVPNSGYVPYVYSNNLNDDYNTDTYETLYLYGYVADLLYRLTEEFDNAWKDIIQSVDIYVSPPIYPYDADKGYSDADENLFVYKAYYKTNGEVIDEISELSSGYGRLMNTGDDGVYTLRRLFDDINTLYGFSNEETLDTESPYILTQLSPKDVDMVDEEIKKESRFYLIKRILFDDLSKSSNFQALALEDGVLTGLEGREALDEDVVAYEQFVGCGLYSYNQRLHTFGGELVYRDITKLPLHVQYLNGRYGVGSDNYVSGYSWYEAWVYIRTNDGTKVVHTAYDSKIQFYGGDVWFFYPNNRAYKVVISYNPTSEEGNDCLMALPLSEHETLNGAYFFLRTERGLWDEAVEQYKIDEPPTGYDEHIASTSIYVSEVNNPFTFKNSTAVTVGSGQILALSSAAQAMSQGQFGQYPLYAFTDEGVWALSVQTDGTYGTSQPIARDVVTNVASITQLDSSVLFVTDRGIMEIAGSTVACISEGIDGEWGEFNPLDLPYFAELYMKYVAGVADDDPDYGEKKSAFEAMITAWSEQRFFNFIKTCRILYDYTHQRIIVYNAGSAIGYNFSLESKEWSLLFTDLRYSVNAYPEALALAKVDDAAYGLPSDEEHWGLVNMSEYVDEGEEEEDVATEMFVTRPFKLDAPDVFKTVDSVVQRGFFQQSAKENHIVGTVLYGSPDLFNWYMVGQRATTEVVAGSGQYTAGHIIDKMQGSPYKYFRVAVLCRLRRKETIYGCSVMYELKDNNQLR